MNRKLLTAMLSASLLVLAITPGAAQAFGISSAGGSLRTPDDQPLFTAGAHPDLTTEISFDKAVDPETGKEVPAGNPRNVDVTLPPGLIGNPTAVPKCTQSDLLGGGYAADCMPETQVGIATITNYVSANGSETRLPVFNMVAPPGVAGQFGFNLLGVLVFVNSGVSNDGEYTLTSKISDISQGLSIGDTVLKLWGVPADSSHDDERSEPGRSGLPREPVPSTAPRLALMSNPTACPGTPLTTTVRADSWQSSGVFDEASYSSDVDGNPMTIVDCAGVPFEASLDAQPTTTAADSPTGLDLTIEIPQNSFPDGRSAAMLRDAVVTLPEGMTVNAASPGGQGACSEEQIDLGGDAPATCPPNSKIGTVEIDSPLLSQPMRGGAYLAQQGRNKFGSLLALYFAVDDPTSGTVLKLAGEVAPDPATGRLVVSFTDNPQLPFERMQVKLFGGPRASLKTPAACGAHTTTGEFTPWSGTAPIVSSESFRIVSGPNGGPCPSGGFDPAFDAGSTNPVAGEYSPFVLRLGREPGNQALGSLDAALPTGLLARLAGTPYCPETALAAIPAAAGTGAAQLAAPSCPAASRVGRVTVSTGVGPSPFTVGTGRAYLAGPYRGAPLSLAIVTPAVAGPFDLGNVVVRAALHVDPVSTQVRAVSDPLPTILHGIPLELRDVVVHLDRDGFTRNPTSCAPKAIAATIRSAAGTSVTRSERFQVAGCRGLDFRPRLGLRLKGSTKRGGHPALTATLGTRPGEANLRRVSVALPPSEILAQENMRTICTRVQWAADSCPRETIYGRAVAHTPLLDEPLRGPVYLRASGGKLPNLVADLRGRIDVELVGRIDSHRGGIRTTFATVPDAPVTKFVLRMQGGKKSLLSNTTNICARAHRATVRMDAQNGRAHDTRPRLRPRCRGRR